MYEPCNPLPVWDSFGTRDYGNGYRGPPDAVWLKRLGGQLEHLFVNYFSRHLLTQGTIVSRVDISNRRKA